MSLRIFACLRARIMAAARQEPNRVRPYRESRGWSQAELARRAGISRAAVSAIEVNRLVPSVTAALGYDPAGAGEVRGVN
jgi:DNA-binding XRE family transcriptional regulator